MEYRILKASTDFDFLVDPFVSTKGSRYKRIAIDKKTNEEIYFKYESYNCSESCSEKLCYEIAKVLDYSCARIEFGEDENQNIGVLNYLFVNRLEEIHLDAISYINKDSSLRCQFYTIKNIKKCLDQIDSTLFDDFLKIMVFDALVGESDRHEENWGITKSRTGYKISPLYDNGCNLLRNFKNEFFAEKYYNGIKDFQSYIRGAKSLIYKDDGSGKYNLLDLIQVLYQKYPEVIGREIKNLSKLTDQKIENIVSMIPEVIISFMHKKYIIEYLKTRRRLLEDIVRGGGANE